MIDNKIKNTIKYPTSLIINGVSNLGLEVAASLMEQGGYVIIVDAVNETNFYKIIDHLGQDSLLSFIDYADIPYLEKDLRRLDYTFYLSNEVSDPYANIETQEFLKSSNYLDAVLSAADAFEAKFLLATSMHASYELMKLEYNVSEGRVASSNQYKQMDINKYAESLVLEYVEKTGLKARVVRIGEIIGDGLDLGKDTVFNSLVLQAIRGQKLTVPGDGLESEYYVHLLDAAYGVIKAQFTPQTIGQVYTISYEVPITNLSIAYRLQELEPNTGEITFTKDYYTDSHSLRLQRSAPSLSQLGWQPRIDLDQAISESLVAAKSAKLDQIVDLNQEQEGFMTKVKSFLNLTKDDEMLGGLGEENSTGGPVDRLIAERQRQQKIRAESFDRADDEIKLKKRQRRYSFGERVQNWLWARFQRLQSIFGFLSDITPAQFVLYSVLFAVLLVGYFAVVSPTFVIGRNLLLIRENLRLLDQHIKSNDFKSLAETTTSISNYTSQNQDMLGGLQTLAGLVAAEDFVEELMELNAVYIDIAEGSEDVAHAVEPMGEYLQNFTNNVRFRGNTENYLAVGNSIDYGESLTKIVDRRAFAESGSAKIADAISKLKTLKFDVILAPQIGDFNENLINTATEVARFSELAIHAPTFLGVDGQQRYLFVLLDNSRPMPMGGEMAAIADITVSNGAIATAKLTSIDELDVSQSSLPDFVQDTVPVKQLPVQIDDYDLIIDDEIFADAMNLTWQQHLGAKIDGVFVITTAGLEQLVKEITVEGVQLQPNNLLSSLNLLQGNDSVARRNDLLAQIFANVIVEQLNKIDTSLLDTIQQIAVLAQQELFLAAADNSTYNSAAATDSPVSVFAITDPRIANADRYPTLSQSTSVEILNDLSLNYEYIVRFPGINNISNIVMCVPSDTINLEVTNLQPQQYDQLPLADDICINASADGITELAASWQVRSLAQTDQSDYNISLGFGKPTGVGVTSNVEVSLASGLTLNDLQPKVAVVGGRFGITQNLESDQVIILDVTK